MTPKETLFEFFKFKYLKNASNSTGTNTLKIGKDVSLILSIFNFILMRDVIENSPVLQVTDFYFPLAKLDFW